MEAPAKIIVVDDEKQICLNVAKILSKNDYDVTHVLSAQEALDKMAADSYSLLISDIVMPGKNGLELLKMVKKEWPLTKAIMMTAYAATDTAMKAIQLGALDYIPKPFTPDELRTTVEQALSGKLAEARFSRQLLRQPEFEVLKAVAADGPAEAHYGGFADLGLLGQIDDAHMDDVLGPGQYQFGHLALGAAHLRHTAANVLQQVVVFHRVAAPVDKKR